MRDDNGTLTDAGARLLVHRAGSTPVYAYDRQALRASVERVRSVSAPGAGLYYSLKANPHAGVVNALVALVDGFDVCSLTEMETVLNAGALPEHVLFTGPAKSEEEMAAALAAGVMVSIESPGQARLLAATSTGLGLTGRAVIRLNVPYPGRTPHEEPLPNQFGVAEDDVPEVIEALHEAELPIIGLQLFWGSQYADAEVVLSARADAVARARACVERFGLAPDLVSIGGGIALPWCDADPEVDWEGLRAAVTDQSDSGETLPLVYEYGRSIVGPSGTLLTRVLDTKTVDGRRYVLVDAGMNHALLASRLVAGGERGEPRVRALGGQPGGDVGRAHVTGPLCSRLDVLAEDVELPEVISGDLIALSDMGAYGPTFSPGGFLSRDQVKEIVF